MNFLPKIGKKTMRGLAQAVPAGRADPPRRPVTLAMVGQSVHPARNRGNTTAAPGHVGV